uniref:HTH psq-type domain-containing protein n=1 Tax=Cacopsylla melanoneura TaxID=428564 RepID=A0A8D8X868_9HEMI
MVSNYKRKSKRQEWDATAMERAIEAVTSGRMGMKTAATSFQVPRTTLRRRVANKNLRATGNKKTLGRFQTVFTAEQEQELVDHILKMEVRFYGVTIKDLQYLAYHIAEVNNISAITFLSALARRWPAGIGSQGSESAIQNYQLGSPRLHQLLGPKRLTSLTL